ncbi:hypothetical protein [Paenibacillus thiaminolyticus]|uniref:hypothetical protein n=1 Tax=Paenibacillus thiaminolyticus TaxID=49283 RepID=UPI0011C355B0|nr:hypothetical protein [Paenibacillus thiaminolyticus]
MSTDTTGMGNPVAQGSLQDALPDFFFSLHLHNTRGKAFVGNKEDIRDFDSSTAGLGGCPYAPNASGHMNAPLCILRRKGSPSLVEDERR